VDGYEDYTIKGSFNVVYAPKIDMQIYLRIIICLSPCSKLKSSCVQDIEIEESAKSVCCNTHLISPALLIARVGSNACLLKNTGPTRFGQSTGCVLALSPKCPPPYQSVLNLHTGSIRGSCAQTDVYLHGSISARRTQEVRYNRWTLSIVRYRPVIEACMHR
jgi:hypothetical protein